MPQGAVAPETTKEISMQAGLDQLEAGIGDAHSILNEIQGTPVPPENAVTAEPVVPGARAALSRCSERVHALNSRLGVLRDSVGTL